MRFLNRFASTRASVIANPIAQRTTATVPYLFYIVYVMFARDYLGEFEHLVLLALVRLKDRAYGVTIRQEIETRANRDVSVGAVYATLDRMEAKGYVVSSVGEPTKERGGRSKRFFHITLHGVRALNRTQLSLRRMTEGLEPLWNIHESAMRSA